MLEAHELHGFISESDQTPPETVTDAAGATKPNPALVTWKRQDKMLYSSMLETLTLNIQPVVARATTTREIWLTLHNNYGKPSRDHVKQLKQHLKRSNKRTQSVTEYMRGILAKANQLALLGSPLDYEDLLDIIIDGLNDDFRAIVEMVNGRDVPILLEELHEKLLNRENALATSKETYGSSVPITTNIVQNRQFQQPQRPYFRGQSPSRGGYQGRGRGYLGKC